MKSEIQKSPIALIYISGIGLLLYLTACGYHFGRSGPLPGGVTRLQIAMLENRTSEMGLENLITAALAHEFRQHQTSLLVTEGAPNGILRGVITAVRQDTITRLSLETGGEKRMYITLDLTLTDVHGHTVWAIRQFTEQETFRAGFDPEANRYYQNEAVQKLARRLAEGVYGQLTGAF